MDPLDTIQAAGTVTAPDPQTAIPPGSTAAPVTAPAPSAKTQPLTGNQFILDNGQHYDLDSDLASQGMQIVGQGPQSFANNFINRANTTYQVYDQQDQKVHSFDADSYILNKTGQSVDRNATFAAAQAQQKAAADAQQSQDTQAKISELKQAGFWGTAAQAVFPNLSSDVKQVLADANNPTASNMAKPPPSVGQGFVAAGEDALSLPFRTIFGLYDQAKYALSGGKSGAPLAASMAADSDPTTDPLTNAPQPSVTDGLTKLANAYRMDPAGVAADVGRGVFDNGYVGADMILNALGDGIPAIAEGSLGDAAADSKLADFVNGLAAKYPSLNPIIQGAKGAAGTALDVAQSAAKVVSNTQQKIAALSAIPSYGIGLAKSVLIGSVGGTLGKWARNDDQNAWNTFVSNGVQMGAFHILGSIFGGAANAVWDKMSPDEQTDYVNRVGTAMRAQPSMNTIPTPDEVPLLTSTPDASVSGALPPPGGGLGSPPDWSEGEYQDVPQSAGALPNPATPSLPTDAEKPLPPIFVPQDQTTGAAAPTTTVFGQDVPVTDALPDGISRREAIQKRYDTAFKTAPEKAADQQLTANASAALADAKGLASDNDKYQVQLGNATQAAFKEALADEMAARDAATAKGKQIIEAHRASLNAIADPTTPTPYEDWNRILGSDHNTIAEKRAAFEDFHVAEAQQARAIRERVNPPEADENGNTPAPFKAPDVVTEAAKANTATRFNPAREAALDEAIKAKLAQPRDLPEDHPVMQQLAAAKEELRTDKLTGLPNQRAHLEDMSDHTLGSAHGTGDVDGFKRFNDEQGHPVGDQALKDVGREGVALAKEMGGKFYRGTQGDEFPYRTKKLADVGNFYNELNTRLQKYDYKGRKIKLSWGRAEGPDPEKAYKAADKDMYARRAAAEALPLGHPDRRVPDRGPREEAPKESVKPTPRKPRASKPAQKADEIKNKPIRLFDESRLDELKRKIDEELGGTRFSSNNFFNLHAMAMLAEYGGILVQKGINNFLDWSDKMVAAFGEKIRPFLDSAWALLKHHPETKEWDPELATNMMEMGGLHMEKQGADFSEGSLTKEFTRRYGEGAQPYAKSIYEALKRYPEGGQTQATTRALAKAPHGPAPADENSSLPDRSSAAGLRAETSDTAGLGGGAQSGVPGASGRNESKPGSNRRDPERPPLESRGTGAIGTETEEPQGGTLKGDLAKNLDLTHKGAVEMTPAKRRDANAQAKEILARVWTDLNGMTPADREVLRQYSGLGGIDVTKTDATADEDHGVRYQHYTSYQVVKAVWRMVEALGFNTDRRGLSALEPTAGIGNFIGFSPRQIKWRANEVDPTSGKILNLLYPQNVQNSIAPFESYVGPKMDMVMTNVPFLGSRGRFESMETDPAYKHIPNLHNYVIMKGVDQLRDNGLGVFLTSTGTMDAKDGTEFRRQLNQKAEVVAAVRLPEGAFKKNTQYEGTVDLIVLRKRTHGEMTDLSPEERTQKDFVATREVPVETQYGGKGIANRSEYYETHPDHVMGQWVYGHNKAYTQSGVALPVPGGSTFEKELGGEFERLNDLPTIKGAYAPREGAIDESVNRIHGESVGPADPETPTNGLEEKNGKIYRRMPDGDLYPFRPEAPPKGKEYAIPDHAYGLLTEIMGLTQKLYGAISDGRDQSFLQNEIKARLDAWKDLDYKKQPKADGAHLLPGVTPKPKSTELQFRDPALETWVDQDRRYHLMRSLYNSSLTGYSRLLMDQVKKTKPPVVERGDMTKGADVMNYLMKKNGYFDDARAREEFKGNDGDYQKEMNSVPSLNYDGEKFVHDRDFLVGNLWPKIEDAEAAGRTKELAKLKAALPPQKTAADVDAAPQSTWWSPDALSSFARGAGFDLGRGQYLDRIPDAEGKLKFRIGTLGNPKQFDDGENLVDGDIVTLPNFVDIVLNQEVAYRRVPDPLADGGSRVIADPQLTTKIRDQWRQRFETWARSAVGKKYSEEAATSFNHGYAGTAKDNYSEEKMFINGLGTTINHGLPLVPYGSQYSAVRMFKNLRGGMLAHGVGYGKTLSAILQYAQGKQDGWLKKAVFVVPGKTLLMWRDNFQEALPNTSVKVIRSEEERTRIPDMQDAAVGNYDVVLISHDGFTTVPLKSAAKYMNDDLTRHREVVRNMEIEKRSKKGNSSRQTDAVVKRINDKMDRLTNKMRSIQEATTDPRIVSFEDWDVDALWADEAHAYKNYFDILHEYADKQFLNTGKDSDVGNDFAYKARYLHEKNGGHGGVTLLTATPTPNKPIEVYKMLKLIAPDELQSRGLNTMDDFVRNFVDIGYANSTGLDAIGGKPREMVLNYRNVQALQDMVKSHVDIRLKPSDEMKKFQPDASHQKMISDMSDAQMFGMAKIVTLAKMGNEALKELGYDKLTLTGEARMLAVDPARVDPSLLKSEPDFTQRSKKLGEVMKNVEARYKEFKRLQLIFLDEFKIRDVMPVLDGEGKQIEWPGGFGAFKNQKGENYFPRWVLAQEGEQRQRLIQAITQRQDLANWPIKRHNGADLIPERPDQIADYRPIFGDDGKVYVGRREIVDDLHDRMADYAQNKIGIPRNEIAVVNGEKNSKNAEKRAIEERVAAGELKLLIGNRAAMGEGMNLQAQGDAIHQVDVPWNEMALTQSDGRFIRRRNDITDKHPVTVFNYGAKGSLDAMMYDTVGKKKDWNDALWTGTADKVSNSLDNLQQEGFSPEEMKKALQVNNAYVDGYQAFTQVQMAKRINAGAMKEYSRVQNDLNRAREQQAGMLKVVENAQERIRNRIAAHEAAMQKYNEEVISNPKARQPEVPSSDHDQQLIIKNLRQSDEAQNLIDKTEEKLQAFSKVTWESEVVAKADKMLVDAKANKFHSYGSNLSAQLAGLEGEAARESDTERKLGLGVGIDALKNRLETWRAMVSQAIPDISAKFAHLADMVATMALGNKVPEDFTESAGKIGEFAQKYQAGGADPRFLGAIAATGAVGAFFGAPAAALGGIAGALLYGLVRMAKTAEGGKVLLTTEMRMRKLPGFDAIGDLVDKAYFERQKRTAVDLYGVGKALKGLDVDERNLVTVAVESAKPNGNPKIDNAARVVRGVAARIAQAYGIPTDPLYFPRVFDWDKVSQMKDPGNELFEKNLEHLKSTQGWDDTRAAAYILSHFDNTEDMKRSRAKQRRVDMANYIREKHPNISDKGLVDQYIRMKQAFGSYMNGNLQMSRRCPKLIDEMYLRDPAEVLPRYVTSAWRTIVYRNVFGEHNAAIERWLDSNWPRYGEEKPAAREEAEDMLDAELYQRSLPGLFTKDPYGSLAKGLRKLREYQTNTKLFTSVLSPARTITAGMITMAPTLNAGAQIKGIVKFMGEAAKGQPFKQAVIGGAISTRAMWELYGLAQGKTDLLSAGLRKNPVRGAFMWAHQFVHAVAYHAGQYHADDVFKNALKDNKGSAPAFAGNAYTELKKVIGEDEIQRDLVKGALSKVNREKMGLKYSEDVGGSPRNWKIPAWMNTEEGRVISQFKNLAWQQGVVLQRNVIRPAMRGNFVPLLKWGATVGASVWVMALLAKMLYGPPKKKEDENNPAVMLLHLANTTNATGVLGDIAEATLGSNDDWKAKLMAGTFGGPSASTALNLATSLADATQTPGPKGGGTGKDGPWPATKEFIRNEIPLANRLSKWESGPFTFLAPETQSKGENLKGMKGLGGSMGGLKGY